LGLETTDHPYLRLARPLNRQGTRPAEQLGARLSKGTSSVVISYVGGIDVYLTMIFPVMRGWIEQK